jgi:hypothetical protein
MTTQCIAVLASRYDDLRLFSVWHGKLRHTVVLGITFIVISEFTYLRKKNDAALMALSLGGG